MSDVYEPPPPPLPAAPPSTGYDFLRPFVFLFDDQRWLPKVLMGGAFFLLAVLIVGIPFLLGYIAKLIRNVIAGDPTPLPEWVDLGDLFSEGLTLFGVGLIYMLPMTILSILISIPAALTGASSQEEIRAIGSGVFGCASCIVSMASFAISLLLPAALLMVVTTRRFSAAFEFGAIWSFIRANVGNYLLAIVTEMLASLVSGVGLVLCCVGIVFTQFWAAVVTAYALGRVYRAATVR
jgi:Protein of unknown function (DUF4013)